MGSYLQNSFKNVCSLESRLGLNQGLVTCMKIPCFLTSRFALGCYNAVGSPTPLNPKPLFAYASLLPPPGLPKPPKPAQDPERSGVRVMTQRKA